MKKEELCKIHKMSIKNRDLIGKADKCGCFYCEKVFSPREIVEWIWGDTAVCPYCGIDSVIAEGNEQFITEILLKEMKNIFFEDTKI